MSKTTFIFAICFITPWIIGQIVEKQAKESVENQIWLDWQDLTEDERRKIMARSSLLVDGIGSNFAAGCSLVIFVLLVFSVVLNLL